MRILRSQFRFRGFRRRSGLLRDERRWNPGGRDRNVGRVHLRAADLGAHGPVAAVHDPPQRDPGPPCQGPDDCAPVPARRRGGPAAAMTAAASRGSRWRSVVAPGLATLVALAILVSLGIWQLERKARKEGLIARIEARAYGPPGALAREADWPSWSAAGDEFRRVRL